MPPAMLRIDISGSSNDSFIQMFEMQLPSAHVVPERRVSAEPVQGIVTRDSGSDVPHRPE
jgi:hypothetical protein